MGLHFCMVLFEDWGCKLIISPYADVEFADEFFALYLGDEGMSEWEELDEDAKTALLVRATLAIDLLDNIKRGFKGEKSCALQVNAFPRDGVMFVPEKVKLACALEALALVDEEAAQRRSLRQQGVSGISVGNAKESYVQSGDFDSGLRGRGQVDFSERLVSREAFGLMMEFLDIRGVHAIL